MNGRHVGTTGRSSTSKEPPPVIRRVASALPAIYRDETTEASAPAAAFVGLADLYLAAAANRSRHIALVWPTEVRTLALVHALATVARWAEGDKLGVRGAIFPAKSNVFHPLNHMHLDRGEIFRCAQDLLEIQRNERVARSCRDKDAFLFALGERSLAAIPGEPLHPTVGELLPHFYAEPGFTGWVSCNDQLLAQIRGRLTRRAHAKALQANCSSLGEPRVAPDACFAFDGRMEEAELRRALRAVNAGRPLEVVLVNAGRLIRREGSSGWKNRLARFCLMLEEVCKPQPPGVLVVTDEAHAAEALKNELWKLNKRREAPHRWRMPDEYAISGFPCTSTDDGLLEPGQVEILRPLPRELDVHIVDAEAAKVVRHLMRIATEHPGGRKAAQPIADAADYLARMAALPCGVRHLAEHLADPEISDRTRRAFDWPNHVGAVQDFERTVGVGGARAQLETCLQRGSDLFVRYAEATPFAHRLAKLIATTTEGRKQEVTVVFTSGFLRHLAERFLEGYEQYPSGVQFAAFRERVHLIPASCLEGHLEDLGQSSLVFAGLNDRCLRTLLSDDRVPAHTAVLLTQRAGQFLRFSLEPLVERMPEFRPFKPRVESLLRQLRDLPVDAVGLASGDYVLPAFRIELSGESTGEGSSEDPDVWRIRLDNGQMLFRRDTHDVYVYEPASHESSDRGFRPCQVRSLAVGDKLFVMSSELRELVEETLREAGVPIESDRTFEAALRAYHQQVVAKLAARFPATTRAEQVRALRKAMLTANPKIEGELPLESTMRHWISLGESPHTPFEQLRPQAPLRESTFKAFAEALGFSALEAAYQWQRVIMAVRNSRRLDGRHVSDVYTYMLLRPESVMAHSNIKRSVLKHLFDKARDNLATVTFVGPNRGAPTS